MTTKDTEKTYFCSFCRKSQQEVHRMIAGPNQVYICDECVDLCNRVIAEAKANERNERTEQAATVE